MKQGLNLDALVLEIQRQSKAKLDIVASTDVIEAVPTDDGITLQVGDPIGDGHEFGVNQVAGRQLAAHTGIPADYYDRMAKDAPELLARNVNTWLHRNPTKRMIRTLDGKARAFLSDSYRPLEYDDLVVAVLPALLNAGAEIMSAQITETRLYIKAIDKRVVERLPSGARFGDGSHHIMRTLSPGIVIGDSEVGHGSLYVESAIWDGFCTNLATFGKTLRKTHLGAKHEITDGLYELLSDQTRSLTDKALWHQVGDVITAQFNEAKFKAFVEEKLLGTTEQKITGDPVKVVNLSAKKFGMAESEKTSVLRHLIEGGDLSRFGLYNAVTRTAEDVASYDRASEFERLGGKIIELPRNEWQVLAEAA